ncbi:hypothetical protein PAE2_17 [Pseudomonas phage PAE2]|nr:hypothetical protein PAE2_17 [Pseudomonas phage PAE2]
MTLLKTLSPPFPETTVVGEEVLTDIPTLKLVMSIPPNLGRVVVPLNTIAVPVTATALETFNPVIDGFAQFVITTPAGTLTRMSPPFMVRPDVAWNVMAEVVEPVILGFVTFTLVMAPPEVVWPKIPYCPPDTVKFSISMLSTVVDPSEYR